MPNLLLLTGDVRKARNDNHIRIPDAFAALDWRVDVCDHDRVEVRAGTLVIGGADPVEYDLIWPLGFGRADTFLDRMQLLRRLPSGRLVTTPDALLFLHGKHQFFDAMAETHTSTDLDYLLTVVAQGGEWVLKPTAGSYGRDVVRLGSLREAREVFARLPADGCYWQLQRYLPEIEAGEKRTLIAGGAVIGTYLRRHSGDFRHNLARGADAETTTLDPQEADRIRHLAARLSAAGVGFAAIDTAGEWLVEVNVANPGGLATLEALYGPGATLHAAREISRLGSR